MWSGWDVWKFAKGSWWSGLSNQSSSGRGCCVGVDIYICIYIVSEMAMMGDCGASTLLSPLRYNGCVIDTPLGAQDDVCAYVWDMLFVYVKCSKPGRVICGSSAGTMCWLRYHIYTESCFAELCVVWNKSSQVHQGCATSNPVKASSSDRLLSDFK